MAKNKFINNVTRYGRFRWFLISRLPMVWLAGIRVKSMNEGQSEVTVPFKYLTKNPFRSIYFACQAMAAELSTGLFAVMHIERSNRKVSMLVVGMEALYHKKADSQITFTCDAGKEIGEAVSKAVDTGEGVEIKVKSSGTLDSGELVAEFYFTWSFKTKG